MREFISRNDYQIKLLLLAAVILIGILGAVDLFDLNERSLPEAVRSIVTRETVTEKDKCGKDCKEEIDKKVSEALATVSGKLKNSLSTSETTKTSSVSIGSTFSTRSADWTDVPGQTEVDPGEYGASPAFYVDASVKIGNSNGEVKIRLFDITNGIAVSGSELSTVTSSYSNVSSSALLLWRGKNLYKIQIKSTIGEEAFVASAKIRVVYK
ncbi:MAG: hypothetical protein A2700_01045 [Candidatus Blackburnbacteria bacterium RIFCSPHIGHO2_01_FULL_44_64]|nr:MAG: hypothetical protein A2700_01045 [Candidatus Blackburnbacteria bacterium RIFCSPHIGHO2_01_FULL_44_64]